MFSHGYITNNGKELIARAVAGEKLTFTRMEYGDGVLEGVDTAASEDEIKTLYQGVEGLVNKCADVALVDVVTEGNVSTVRGMLLFESYTKAFSARELAVFGRVGEEEERIVAYFGSVDSLGGEVQDASDFILLTSKDRPHYVTVDVITSSVSGIGVEYDPRVYVSQADFAAHKEENSKDFEALKNIVNNILLAAHPVGSLYWSSDPTNPSALFGGTWEQITDKFIYAAGSKTVGTTGGSETVRLTESNLPAHNHYYTPSGSVESHHHGLNGHKHGLDIKTSNMSGFDYVILNAQPNSYNNWTPVNTGRVVASNNFSAKMNSDSSGEAHLAFKIDLSHTHSCKGYTGGNSGNTTDTQPSFTGTRGRTEDTGSGSAVDVMNPYIVKYCWERTA